jgi:hypothetical protein
MMGAECLIQYYLKMRCYGNQVGLISMEMIQPVRNGYYVHSGGCENEI